MRIAAIPIADKTSASRRIRYKAFRKALPIDYHMSKFRTGLQFDVLYIQKLIRDWTIKIARDVSKKGVPVVLDLDDIRENWSDKPYDAMLRYVSAVTTDTELKAVELRKHTDKPVFVVPDTIDYGAVEADPITIEKDITTAVTFGRWQNVVAVPKVFPKVHAKRKYYICDRDLAPMKGWKRVKWDADTILSVLRHCDIALLAHHEHWAVSMKSNNRLLVCMALGLPVLASDCVPYRETLEAAGQWGGVVTVAIIGLIVILGLYYRHYRKRHGDQ